MMYLSSLIDSQFGSLSRSNDGDLRTSTISDGAPGIRQTVKHIIRLCRRDSADPAVVAIARRMKDNTSDERTAHNCFDFVVRTIPYKDDTKMALKAALAQGSEQGKAMAREGTEFLIAPRLTLTRKWIGGDCDDLTNALGALLISQPIGFPYWCRILAWKPGEGFTHINGEVLIPERERQGLPPIIAVDPVMKSAGFGKEKRPVLQQEFFRVK